MKQHPLEIHDFYEFEGPQIACYSKGHHDFEEFANAVRQHRNPASFEWMRDRAFETPRREFWRFVPFSDPSYQKGFQDIAQPGTRGAFPVTVANFID